MKILRVISIRGCVFSVFLLLCLAQVHAEAQRPKLTQAQISHLIQIHAPDALVAQQVKRRGINFAATHANIVTWTTEGAGPQTLAALNALVQTGSLILHTEPGATVSLDGKEAGTTDSTGIFSLQDLSPGNYDLVVTKAGFHSINRPFALADRQNSHLSVPLAWAGGLITISAVPASSTISVTGPVSFSGPLNRTRCPPGTYKIAVSAIGYLPQTESIALLADQSYHKDFRLLVDSQFLATTLAHAEAALSSGNTDSAIHFSTQALNLDPSSTSAHKVLAEASFLKRDYSSFADNARAAIQGGQSVTIPLLHVHDFAKLSVDPVNATISSEAITFTCSPGTECKIPQSVSYSSMETPIVATDPSGTGMLRILWIAGPRSFLRALRQLDFVPVGSTIVNGPRNPNMSIFSSGKHLVTPQDAVSQYEAVINLLRNP